MKVTLNKLLSKISLNTNVTIAFFSLIRYTIFILQYYFIIHSLSPQITFITIFLSISILFLFLFLLPITTLGGLGARDFLLPLILPVFLPELSLLTTVFIWIVNALIPAIIGWIIFLNYNPNK